MSDADLEQWLPVVGYEGLYEVSDHCHVQRIEVSDHCHVQSIDRYILHKGATKPTFYAGQLLKLHLDEFGYLEAVLSRNSKAKTIGVHVLVCTAFHGPKPEWAECVRHLNGIKADCTPGNVIWGTRAENMQDKARHGTNYWLNQTRCKWGHEWTPENTRYERDGRKRCCRQCGRDKNRRRRAALAQAKMVAA